MPFKLDLTALVGSRICHDLISPIGAIGNGVELMLMEGARSSPEMVLVGESVTHANAKIRFFRLAFGAASPDQELSRLEFSEILSDVTMGTRLRVELRCLPRLPRPMVKLASLLHMCLETAMPYGGVICIDQSEGGWSMTGTAERLNIDAPLWDHLAGGGAGDLTPAHVQFALVRQELANQHRRLTTQIGADKISFNF